MSNAAHTTFEKRRAEAQVRMTAPRGKEIYREPSSPSGYSLRTATRVVQAKTFSPLASVIYSRAGRIG